MSISEVELSRIVQNSIRTSLASLCDKLEKGECADRERDMFQEDLARGIGLAVAQAMWHGVRKY